VKNLFSDKRGQIFPDEPTLYKLEKFFFSLATMRRTMPPQDLDQDDSATHLIRIVSLLL
jgi:hypothetical protein